MYRSVGKLLASLTITLRPGWRWRCTLNAALSTLNRLMEVVSVITTSPSRAPINGARRLPRRWDNSAQPALFQLRIKHCPTPR